MFRLFSKWGYPMAWMQLAQGRLLWSLNFGSNVWNESIIIMT
jgi:hypothetical protein